ncbi:MAG: ATP-binding protein [Rhodothermaceae bacterium]
MLTAQRFNVTHYNNQTGLPEQRVLGVVQLKNGKMFFLHEAFLSVYDGSSWEIEEQKLERSIRSFKVCKDNDEKLWFYSDGIFLGIKTLHNGKWKIFSNGEHNQYFYLKRGSGLIRDLIVTQIDNSDHIAKCDERSVYYYDGKWKFVDIPKQKEEIEIFDLEFIDKDLYIASSGGIYIYNRDSFKILKPKNLGAPSDKVIAVKQYTGTDNKRQIWLLGENWIGYIENSKLEILDRFDFSISKALVTNQPFFEVFENDLFFGGINSVYFFNKKSRKTKKLTVNDGLISNGATQVFEDREKNIWITSLKGITKLRRREFITFDSGDGLLENEVSAISQLSNGDLVLGYNSGIGFFDEKNARNIKFGQTLKDAGFYQRVFNIDVENDNAIWFTSSHVGIGKLNKNGKIKWYSSKENNSYLSFYRDSEFFLVGTPKGVKKFEKNKFLDWLPNTKNRYIRGIEKFDDNSFLIAARDGVLKHNINGTSNFFRGPNEPYCFLRRDENSFYVGSRYGLFLLKDELVQTIKLAGKEIRKEVYFLKNDKTGNLWIGTNNGIYVWNRKDLVNINTENGFPHNETNRGAGFCDKDGNFWVGTARGLVKFETVPQKPDTTKPFLEFKEYKNFEGKSIKLNKREIEVAHDENNFTMIFNGVSFIDENKLEYEISILDHHTEKINSFMQKNGNYRLSNLAEGEYTFTVRVKNPYGILSDPSSVKIVIAPPYYKTYWFVLLMMGVVIFVAIFIQNFFHQRSYSKRLKKEVDERTKSLNISNKKYRIISETIEEITWNFNKDLELDYVSPTVKKLLGYSPEALQKLDEQKSIVERFCEYFEEFDIEKLKRESIVTEFKYVTKSNKTLNFEIFTTPVLNHNKFQGVIGVTREISQRKARERVKSAAIIQTVEVERRRIARELHDNLGQILASIKLRLEVFRIKNSEDKDIGEAYEQLSLVKKELKTIIENLNPLPYGKIDLIDALRDICETHRRKKIINTEFVLESNVEYVEMKEDHRLMIYRIVQEALTNAILYSYAEEIRIEVEKGEKEFRLRVVDNGRGFEMGRMKEIEGFGFQNMRQRASVLGAELNIESEEGKGTVISLKI